MERTESMTRASAPVGQHDGSYVDWAAVLGGATIATAIAALFTAFGAALGLTALSAEPGEGSFNFAIILSGVWMVITLVASYAIGGYVAGRMRRRVDQASADEVSAHDGINGLVVWGLGMLVGAIMLTSAATSAVSAVGSAADTVISAAGATAGGMADGAISAAGALLPDGVASNPLAYVTDTLLRPAAADPLIATPESLTRDTAAILGNYLVTGEITDQERAYLETAVAANTALTPAEVTARVDAAIASAQTARDEAAALAAEAEELAINVAEAARISAILTAFLLTAASLVAGATACVAAVRGGRHRDEGRIFGGLAFRI